MDFLQVCWDVILSVPAPVVGAGEKESSSDRWQNYWLFGRQGRRDAAPRSATLRAVYLGHVSLAPPRWSLLTCDGGVADRHTPRVMEQSQKRRRRK